MTGRCSTGPQRVRRPGHIQRSRPGCGYPRRGWLQVHLSADRQGVQHLEGDGAVRLEEGLQGAAAETARVGPRRSASKGPPSRTWLLRSQGSRSPDLLGAKPVRRRLLSPISPPTRTNPGKQRQVPARTLCIRNSYCPAVVVSLPSPPGSGNSSADRALLRRWRQVHVPLGGAQVRVTCQLLDRLRRRTPHCEPRAEGRRRMWSRPLIASPALRSARRIQLASASRSATLLSSL